MLCRANYEIGTVKNVCNYSLAYRFQRGDDSFYLKLNIFFSSVALKFSVESIKNKSD